MPAEPVVVVFAFTAQAMQTLLLLNLLPALRIPTRTSGDVGTFPYMQMLHELCRVVCVASRCIHIACYGNVTAPKIVAHSQNTN